MRGYGQFCPVAQALEILGERWTLLVVRELLCGSRRFNDLLRGVPLMPRTMLANRLRTLEAAGIVVHRGADYLLTDAGEELRPLVLGLGAWGQRWAQRTIDEDDLDASLLMWDLHRRLDPEHLPRERTVVHFELSSPRRGLQRYWLRIEDRQSEVCLTNPGFTVDLVVEADLRSFAEVWIGRASLAAALRAGRIVLAGPPRLKKAFPRWLLRSAFAGTPPVRRAPRVQRQASSSSSAIAR